MNLQATSHTERAEDYVCMDFRREKLADPKRISDAAQGHLSSCILCQAFARRIDKMEAAIADTLSVPLPEGLNDRIFLRVREQSRAGQKIAWRTFALAATVLLTVAISLNVGLQNGGQSDANTQF